ncbi:MAG: aminotransferase class V-fold PLP-dependent enzyme [Bradyrhizobiaceae bacterium]|nr:aminotransferase class V-fold PLP-dependent enzyme [Bradyrhizobiaceae bacterium]
MPTGRVYLDHNATAPLRPAARAAMEQALALPGNASSVHQEGRRARAIVETAREQVAALFGAETKAVTFTSGATEAIATALSPDAEIDGKPARFDVLLISGVEHPAVQAGGRFPEDRVEKIPVDGEGVVNLAALDRLLAQYHAAARRPFVSVMAANNETGVLQPIAEIAARAHAVGGILHSDAVQVAGRLPFDLAASGADLISVSSHKLGGPQGAGALIGRNEDLRVPPLLRGGGQERGRRAGTENVAAIAGFGAAAEEAGKALGSEAVRLARFRDAAEAGLHAISPEAVILSANAGRLPNTLCFAVPGIAAETAVIAFDLEGVALSAGAACSSGKVGPSAALAAMQAAPEIAKGAMRLSVGWSTAESDISRFLDVWKRVYLNLSQRRRGRAA